MTEPILRICSLNRRHVPRRSTARGNDEHRSQSLAWSWVAHHLVTCIPNARLATRELGMQVTTQSRVATESTLQCLSIPYR